MAAPAQQRAAASGRVAKPPAFMFERPLVGGRLAECMPSLQNMQPHLALQVIQVVLEHAWKEREARAKGQAFERTTIMPIELLDDAHVRILLNDDKTFNFLNDVITGIKTQTEQMKERKTQEQLRGRTGKLSITGIAARTGEEAQAEKIEQAIKKLEEDAKIIEQVREQFVTLLSENSDLIRELRLSIIAFWMARHNEALVKVTTLDRAEHAADAVVIGTIDFETSCIFEPPSGKIVDVETRMGKARLPLSFFEPPPEYAHALEIPFYLNGSKYGELEVKSRVPVEPEPLIMLGNLFAEIGARLDVEGKFTEILRSRQYNEEQKIGWICKWFEKKHDVKMSFDAGETKEKTKGEIIVPVVLPSGTRGQITISTETKLSEQTLHEIGNRLGEAGVEADLSIAQRTYEEAAGIIQNAELMDKNSFARAYEAAYQNSVETGAALAGIRIIFKNAGKRVQNKGFNEAVEKALVSIRRISKQAKHTQPNAAPTRGIEDVFVGLALEVAGDEPLVMKHEPIGITHDTRDQVIAGVLLFTDLQGAKEAAEAIARHWQANARELLAQATVYLQPLQLYPPGIVGTQTGTIEGGTIVLEQKKEVKKR